VLEKALSRSFSECLLEYLIIKEGGVRGNKVLFVLKSVNNRLLH
jgi:hypothetical protein